MEREEGGGLRMGDTCIPVADSFRYLAKFINYSKIFIPFDQIVLFLGI